MPALVGLQMQGQVILCHQSPLRPYKAYYSASETELLQDLADLQGRLTLLESLLGTICYYTTDADPTTLEV